MKNVFGSEDMRERDVYAREYLGRPESFEELVIIYEGDVRINWSCAIPCEEEWLVCDDNCEESYCEPWDECVDYCYDEDDACDMFYGCYNNCSNLYDGCVNFCNDCHPLELSSSTIYDFFEIIPAAHAIAGDCGDSYDVCYNVCYNNYDVCYDVCYDDYYTGCVDCYNRCDGIYGDDCTVCWHGCDETADVCWESCILPGDDEVYEWDGSEVTDVGSFFEDNFPLFYDEFYNVCEGWWMLGEWVSTEDTFGCTGIGFLFPDWVCETETIVSVAEVCETIGGEFICIGNTLTCNI